MNDQDEAAIAAGEGREREKYTDSERSWTSEEERGLGPAREGTAANEGDRVSVTVTVVTVSVQLRFFVVAR